MKRISLIFCAAAFFLLSAAMILTAVDVCSFDRGFFEKEYEKAGTAESIGMSGEDLMRSTDALLDYLQGERDDIAVEAVIGGSEREVFNEREILHMVDVRALYRGALAARNVMAAGGAVLLALSFLLARGHFRQLCRHGFPYGIGLTLTLTAVVAVTAALDFTAFWTAFHEFFFTNDLWLLDPNTSIMINMFPETFFFDLVVRILAVTAAGFVITGLAVFQPWRKS